MYVSNVELLWDSDCWRIGYFFCIDEGYASPASLARNVVRLWLQIGQFHSPSLLLLKDGR